MTTYLLITNPDTITTVASNSLHTIASRANSIEDRHVLNHISQRRMSVQQKPSIASVIMNVKSNNITHSNSIPCQF